MKKKLLAFCLLLGLFGTATAQRGYQVDFVSESEGVVYLLVHEFGVKNEVKATRKACLDALEVVIFHGVPHSQYVQRPMITDEKAAKKAHKTYFDRLFSNGYNAFVKEAYVKEKVKTPEHVTHCRVFVGIQYDALYNDLQNYDVVKSFGF